MERKLTESLAKGRSKCDRIDLIKNLNVWGSDLNDISIVRGMPNIEILSLSFNKIRTLADIAYCKKLKELYIRENLIADVREILHLKSCSKLHTLWFKENYCSKLTDYRLYVIKNLPGLRKLDNEEITDEERKLAESLDYEFDMQGYQPDLSSLTESSPTQDRA